MNNNIPSLLIKNELNYTNTVYGKLLSVHVFLIIKSSM